MRPKTFLPSLLLATLAATLAAGCSFGALVSSDGLPLQRVVVYRNGVGYFERAGTVRAAEVNFRVQASHVGDFLATLAVIERGGTAVRSASFPTSVDKEQSSAFGPPLVKVTLQLDGGEHDLQVGYVAETPVWKPSYRLVVDEDGAELQAWGIVHNLSGEDWKDVRLSLVAGAPIAFQSTLQRPVTPLRPTISDRGEVIAAVPRGVTTLEELPEGSGHALAGLMKKAEMKEREMSKRDYGRMPSSKPSAPRPEATSSLARLGGAPAEEVDYYDAPAAAPEAPQPPPLAALAQVAVQAGLTRFDIPKTVTVPDKSATMVLLMAREVPGKLIHLFAPDGGVPDSMRHPFRVARFENAGTGLLEKGPIAIFEAGSFLGQGVTESIPAGGKATIPFALERGVAVDSQVKHDQQGARVFRIMASRLRIQRDTVKRTTYRCHNGEKDAIHLALKHYRLSGSRLHEPPKQTDEQVGSGYALVPMDVPGRSKAELEVEERTAYTQEVGWLSPLAKEAVDSYILDAGADSKVVSQLKEAWTIRETLEKAVVSRSKLSDEKTSLERASGEIRDNLVALKKNDAAADLKRKLTERLGKYSTRLDQITRDLVELDMRIKEQEVRMTDVIRDIKLERSHYDKKPAPEKGAGEAK